MEVSDDYQEMVNPEGVGVPVANMSMTQRPQTSDSPMSPQEEDLSDPDLQDEESGEELPQQPQQGNNHPTADIGMPSSSNPSAPLTHLNNLINTQGNNYINKLKLEDEMKMEALHASIENRAFHLSFPFAMNHYLPGAHPAEQNAPIALSAGGDATAPAPSPHCSESSHSIARNGVEPRENNSNSPNNNPQMNNSQPQQQTTWSFEEQYKQLYEVDNDPKRKSFLDDLFSFNQKRNSPISRLPIMAKQVLDLYELYNLVVARGGLVDVINKKLWQEIIKGLHLPSSITSAAFTLRTQYMKYLYAYECQKLNLSTPEELKVAIDGNKREGRRSSYTPYGSCNENSRSEQSQSHSASSYGQMATLPMVPGAPGAQFPAHLVNGAAGLPALAHHQLLQQGAYGPDIAKLLREKFAGLIMPGEIDQQLQEYIHLANMMQQASPPSSGRQDNNVSPPPSTSSPRDMSRFDMSKYWFNNAFYAGLPHGSHPIVSPPNQLSPPNHHSPPQAMMSANVTLEPQEKALDLGVKSPPPTSCPTMRHSPPSIIPITPQIKREIDFSDAAPPTKRLRVHDDSRNSIDESPLPLMPGTHIKISNQNDAQTGDNSMVVSIEMNGTRYQGVLFATSASETPSTPNNVSKHNAKSSGIKL